MVSDFLQKWRMILTVYLFIYSVWKLFFFLGWEWKRKAAKRTRIIIDFTKNSAVVTMYVKLYKSQVLQKILQMSVFTQEYKAGANETNTNGGLD